jgi:hypothetical protein
MPEQGTMRVGDCVLKKRSMVLRTILILAVLAPHALAQSAGAPESAPIEVAGMVSPIDPHE